MSQHFSAALVKPWGFLTCLLILSINHFNFSPRINSARITATSRVPINAHLCVYDAQIEKRSFPVTLLTACRVC